MASPNAVVHIMLCPASLSDHSCSMLPLQTNLITVLKVRLSPVTIYVFPLASTHSPADNCPPSPCHDPMHSGHSDSIPMISDCFQRFTSLMDHPLAPGPVPLDCIMPILLVLHSLRIYSLLYTVASLQLEDRIDHRSPSSLPGPISAPFPSVHSQKT